MNRNMFIALQGIAWGIIIVFVVVFTIGCSTMTAEFGGGIGATVGLAEEVRSSSSRERIDITQVEARFGTYIPLTNSFDLQLAIGPNIAVPLDDKKTALGLDTVARLYYNDMYPRPYIGMHLGFVYMTGRWQEQVTDWGFTFGPSIGTEFQLDEQSSILVEYRYWHESNGSKVFGTRRPNPGYDTDTIFVLYMIKW